MAFESLKDIKKRFAYVFAENPYPGSPRATLHNPLPGKIFL